MRIWLCIALVTCAALGAAATAQATDEFHWYYHGSLTSPTGGAGSAYEPCHQMWGDQMSVPTGGGFYGTVALITGGGSWYASNRAQGPYVLIVIDIPAQHVTLKAHCGNSTDWTYTYYTDCGYSIRLASGICT